MANYSVLKAAVQAVVKTNGNQEITGANMQSTLISIINSLGTGYQFMGVATPSTSPGTPDYNVAYIGGAGTYANFGTSVTVLPTNIAVFKYNGTWTCEQVTVENGGVFDISAFKAVGGTLATYADLSAALGTGGANVPQELRRGGMSVKYVQTSDNKYVQYRLMSDTFNTTSANWQGVDDEPTAGSKNLMESNGAAKFVKGNNNFDIENYRVTNTTYGVANGWNCSKISVLGLKKIYATVYGGSTSVKAISFWTENDVYIDGVATGSDTNTLYDVNADVPSNANYAIVCTFRNNNLLGACYSSNEDIAHGVEYLNNVVEQQSNNIQQNTDDITINSLQIGTKMLMSYNGWVNPSNGIVTTGASSTFKNIITGFIDIDYLESITPATGYTCQIWYYANKDNNLLAGLQWFTQTNIKNKTFINAVDGAKYVRIYIVSDNEDTLSPASLDSYIIIRYRSKDRVVANEVGYIQRKPSSRFAVLNSNGVVSNQRTWKFVTSEFLSYELLDSIQFDASVYKVSAMVAYDKDFSFVRLITLNNTSGNINADYIANAVYFKICIAKLDESDLTSDALNALTYKYGHKEEISQLQSQVEKLGGGQTPLLYVTDFSSHEDWVSSSNGSVTDDIVQETNGITVDNSSEVFLTANIRANEKTHCLNFNTLSATKMTVYTQYLEGVPYGRGGILVTLDFSNNTIQLGSPYGSGSVSYTFNSNTDYQLRVWQHDKIIKIQVTNLNTGVKSNVLQYTGVTSGNDGLLYDVLSFACDGNSVLYKKYTITSNVKEPWVIFVGDSITVGFTSTVVSGIHSNSWAELCGENCNMPWLKSARGGGNFLGILGVTGEKHYEGTLEAEILKLRPKYVVLTIGTNGVSDLTNYNTFIDKCIEKGIVVILNSLPMRATSSEDMTCASNIVTYNNYIAQLRNTYHLNGARFDLATSVNGEGTTLDTNLFINDFIHPNDAGHQKMYERMMLDCPELFSNI